MAKRGRPEQQGAKPGWMLNRIGVVLNAFRRARKRGEKYKAAVDQAIAAVKTELHPKMPISSGGVKRILAQWSPKSGFGMWVTEPRLLEGKEAEWYSRMIRALSGSRNPVEILKALADDSKQLKPMRISVRDFGFGEIPAYARHNAKHVG
jgi:hypothetical protein